MDYNELDEEIKKLIEKANNIVQIEELKNERLEKLTELRERDGKIKIVIQQKSQELVRRQNDLKAAMNLRKNNTKYFKLVSTYSGEELLQKLEEEIDNYSWDRYSKLQDELYRLTKDKSNEELQKEIDTLEKELNDLEQERSDLVEYSVEVMKEIDRALEEKSS